VKFLLLMLAAFLLLAGCAPEVASSEVMVTLPAAIVGAVSTPVPTANLQPSPTATIRPTETFTPSATWTPSLTFTPTETPSLTPTPTHTLTPSLTPTPTLTPTLTPSLTLTPTETPTPAPSNTSIPSPTPRDFTADPNATRPPTWTPPPPDSSNTVADHYVFSRPISNANTDWVDRNYPYGNTRGGRLQVHHGVEFINPQGTPIRAAGDGVVVYAGSDAEMLFGPSYNYYGNLVVLQHNLTDASGGLVYTLYGHMVRTEVATGQTVAVGQTIGYVGGTGVALGPHLHFEVRVGDPYNFYAVRNPDLWIRPYPGYGTLAGRVTDQAGNLLYDVTITVEDNRRTRYTFSYASSQVSGDSVFGENYTLGDLPAGWYTVTVGEGGRVRFRQYLFVYPNRTTWLNIALN
jgi:murein DD-endopeptidase MepM/ murein hydrolase activator NlpD